MRFQRKTFSCYTRLNFVYSHQVKRLGKTIKGLQFQAIAKRTYRATKSLLGQTAFWATVYGAWSTGNITEKVVQE